MTLKKFIPKILVHILLYGSFLTFYSCGTSSKSDSENAENSSYFDNGTNLSIVVSYSKYYIDGVTTKSLFFKKGYVYFFDLSDSTTNNHPFFIGTNSSGGDYNYEYTSGVTNSRATTGILKFIVPSDSPSTLYYNCGMHSGMGGKITVFD